MAEIVAASGAPRGSVYYLFPGGKEELAVAAIGASAREVTQAIRAAAARTSDAEGFCRAGAHGLCLDLESTGFAAGCPVTTVALDSTPASPALNAACRAAYDGWLHEVSTALQRLGVARERAPGLSIMLVAAAEGALVLARTSASTAAIDAVVSEISLALNAASVHQTRH
jgi:TetR/AcrR family transcriptional repressor of lmrAB and yxaGH operons